MTNNPNKDAISILNQGRSLSQSSRISINSNLRQLSTSYEATNKEFLIDLCIEATTYVKYKFLGGGRTIHIDNLAYVVPDNLGLAIKDMLSKLRISPEDFIRELAQKLQKVDTSRYKVGRSAWTKSLYENPYYVLTEVKRKIMLTDTISGNFKLEDRDIAQFYKDVNRQTQVKIIKGNKKMVIGPNYDQEDKQRSTLQQQDKLTNKIRDFLGCDEFNKNKHSIFGCHQGILADIMATYYDMGNSVERVKAQLLIDTRNTRSATTFFKIDLDTQNHLLFLKRIKRFSEDSISILDQDEQDAYKSLFGDNYQQLLLRPRGFAVDAVVNLDFNNKRFTCNATFTKN
ncbi:MULTISPECIES: hypothetical protein [Francisella]|uniref:Uncharacterized protein n=1 Tax=Francisella opportunistica TaxID=2016517 RepID=A0A345JPL3_9GAMM|nr:MULTISPECIES: hypothetical protein [Francisella]APC90933.1 hypothetical protein BBG19_0195 [Francisella sp. MA067296]AXH29259.1 hypothetical protein CGC43_00970 [Francisella opportunistica]AXH30910.1 hypothetical protein CGC44_00965 [Francisella opportunistica]AXH32557.1 hypothetical protein CGC45_00965 [Francisella opportunistica]